MCAIIAGLIGGRFDNSTRADRELFEKHMSPRIGRFFADLEHRSNGEFYRGLGTIGRLFVNIERDAFALAS